MHHLYCVLCGVVLSYNWEGQTPPSPLRWHQEIRALTRSPGDEKPVLSGVGFIESETYRVNFDPPRHYTEPGALGAHAFPWSLASMTYLFHDACWKLLPRWMGAVPGAQGSEERVAELLFHLLRCLRKDKNGVPLTPHTFGGISWHRDSYGLGADGYKDSLKDSLRYVMADPRLDLEEEIRESRGRVSCQWQTRQGPPISRETTNSRDPFARLPREIIALIMDEMLIGTAYHFRRASRAVASVTSPPDLPQSFWERRFVRPFEMGYIFAGDAPPVNRREIDWRALYARVRSSVAAKAPGIMNRRRITQCSPVICNALLALLRKANRDWPPAEPRIGDDVLPEGCRLGPWVGSQTTLRYDAQYLPLCGLGDSLATISASFIRFNCAFYISGFRVTSPDGNGRMKTIHEIGINIPDRQQHVKLSQASSVSGVRVYTSWGGVVGLEFLSRDGSLGTLSTWCGEPPDKYAAVAELCPRDSTRLDGLIVYLDICKCIALQAVEARPTDHGSTAANIAGFANTTEPPCLPVWKRRPPPGEEIDLVRVNSLRLSPQTSPETSSMLLNMDFGGPRGEKLRLLNRVVALLDGRYGLFTGLEFFYDDGTRELHGSRHLDADAGRRTPSVEQSLVVCGKQGERITEIHVTKVIATVEMWVAQLRFQTNMGSEHRVQMLGRKPRGDEITEDEILKPREGHVLTGVLAKSETQGLNEIPNGTLSAAGVVDAPEDDAAQGAASGDASAQMVPLQRTIELHGQKRCLRSSAANLQDVTRIRFSAGTAHQYPRDDKHITGLMLHFRGSERAAIVGQWITEVGSMDIDDGDRIAHVRVYYKPKRRGLSTVFKERRRVCGIVVGTARGARKAVLGRECEETFYNDYYANPLEDMDGITWGFNNKMDRVQTVTVPSPRAGNRTLQFHTTPELHDLRRFLWTEVDREGNDVRLSAIEAYFAPDHLSGLRFVYGGGVERSVGHCEGELATLRLAPGEKIGAMAVDVQSENGHVLVFHTNLQETVFLHHPSSEVGLADEGHTRYQMDKESIIWTPKSEAEELKVRGEVVPPIGARECVGIWVTPQPTRPPVPSIREVGPIFLEDAPQGE